MLKNVVLLFLSKNYRDQDVKYNQLSSPLNSTSLHSQVTSFSFDRETYTRSPLLFAIHSPWRCNCSVCRNAETASTHDTAETPKFDVKRHCLREEESCKNTRTECQIMSSLLEPLCIKNYNKLRGSGFNSKMATLAAKMQVLRRWHGAFIKCRY